MKNKLIFPVLAALSFVLVACGNSNPPVGPDTSESGTSEPTSETEQTTYEVTFNSKGGSAVKKQTVVEGEKATRPANPTKGGHNFADWYTEDTYVNVYDFNTPVTQDFTLYAKWDLSTDPTLVSSVYYFAEGFDTEITLWRDNPDFKAHDKDGWAGSTLPYNMSWRTIMAVDAQGRLCYAVWCPANGYGTPSDYSYACNEYYGKDGVTYLNNPAIKLGDNYASNNADFEIVIPEGGFVLTGHSLGSNDIAAMVSGENILLYSDGADFDEQEARGFNKSHGEWSTRTFKLNETELCIDVYDLATHVTFEGDYSGAFTGDAATATYTKEVKLAGGKKVSFNHFDGVVSTPVNETTFEITGEYGAESSVSKDVEDANTLVINKTGKYTFTLNAKDYTFDIKREVVSDFRINLVDIVGKVPAFVDVAKGHEYTLPTPTEVPAGYTFLRWILADGTTLSNGVYEHDGDITAYAVYDKSGTTVAYAGKLTGFSIDADSELTLWTEGNVLKQEASWIGNGWRMFAIFDSEGRLAYAVMYPPNGYGGPDGDTYMCHSYYKQAGAYATNPAIEVLPGYGPWEPGGSAHNLFNIKVPTGGFAISAHGAVIPKIVNLLTNNAYLGFDGSNENEYIGQINSMNNITDNIFSYSSSENALYSSLF